MKKQSVLSFLRNLTEAVEKDADELEEKVRKICKEADEEEVEEAEDDEEDIELDVEESEDEEEPTDESDEEEVEEAEDEEEIEEFNLRDFKKKFQKTKFDINDSNTLDKLEIACERAVISRNAEREFLSVFIPDKEIKSRSRVPINWIIYTSDAYPIDGYTTDSKYINMAVALDLPNLNKDGFAETTAKYVMGNLYNKSSVWRDDKLHNEFKKAYDRGTIKCYFTPISLDELYSNYDAQPDEEFSENAACANIIIGAADLEIDDMDELDLKTAKIYHS